MKPPSLPLLFHLSNRFQLLIQKEQLQGNQVSITEYNDYMILKITKVRSCFSVYQKNKKYKNAYLNIFYQTVSFIK